MIKQDIIRFYEYVPKGFRWRVVALIGSPGLHAMISHRFTRWCSTRTPIVRYLLKPISAYLKHRMKAKWGIDIEDGARIGPGFVIFHYGGIFIGPGVVIGENCQLSHNVTIGIGSPGSRHGFPTIGNNVAINAGAQIYGKIRIGNNVRIGPNTVVNSDIPDDAIVHHLPMRVVIFPRKTPEKPKD